jgi:hypothetical protein
MRLDIDVFGTEDLLAPLNGQVFDRISVLTAAVIPLTRVALGVFIGEQRPLGGKHRWAGKILRGNQEQLFTLPDRFRLNRGIDIGIYRFQCIQ